MQAHALTLQATVAADAAAGRYYGSFWNGNEHGRGSFLAVDGSTYCGEFREGKGVGTVVVDYADGSRYEGTWNESSVSGVGVSHFNGSSTPLPQPSPRLFCLKASFGSSCLRVLLALSTVDANLGWR